MTQERSPAQEAEQKTIKYMGVELPMAEMRDTAPKKELFSEYVEDPFSRQLERTIATAWALHEPILIEGGTSLGKTTAVKKMCAELGYEVHYQNLNNHTDPADFMGRYTSNPHYKSENDQKYIFADGSVTKAFRREEGKIKVLILDEFTTAHGGVLVRLHEVIDAYKQNGTVTLTEDGNELLEVDKTTLYIIALTNPASGGFNDREPVDPAQIRRWTYHKFVDEVPEETLNASVFALTGQGPFKTPIKYEETVTKTNRQNLPRELLKGIPGMPELTTQYLAFHQAARTLVKEKKLGNNQRQKFSFDDREEPRRVFAYIRRFYKGGNVAETMREALRYFYAGKVLDPKDKKALEEIIVKVDWTPPINPNRNPLGQGGAPQIDPVLYKKEYGNRFRSALRIFEGKVAGPKEFLEGINKIVKQSRPNTPEITFDEIQLPIIPFSDSELEQAKNEGRSLLFSTYLETTNFTDPGDAYLTRDPDSYYWRLTPSELDKDELDKDIP
jgi:MoxR-like ATPase